MDKARATAAVDLERIIQRVLTAKQRRHLHASSSTSLEWIVEIDAVAIGLRTASLVDRISLSEEAARQLSCEFAKLNRLKHLCIFYEQSTMQTFFIFRPLLLLLERPHPVVFINVGASEPVKSTSSPAHFDAALALLVQHLQPADSQFCSFDLSSIIGDEMLARSTMISLAGYLLDYPIVYTLVDDAGRASADNCLGGRELSLVTAVVSSSSDQKATFPSCIASADDIVDGLRATLQERLPRSIWDQVDIRLEGPIVMHRFAL